MTGYCDTCKHLKEELRNLNRLQQSGSASATELRAREDTKQELEKELTKHKSKSREYYKAATDKCKQQWKKIVQLTDQWVLSRSEEEELASTKNCFTATISTDFQQSKLIPSWGKTEQPGSTYYLQKVSHDLFGIVDHYTDDLTVYISDEHIGPKNTDHSRFWCSFGRGFTNSIHGSDD